ncbi:copper homeostasis membrane protein CopD [Croceicoccus bisphenolivorans]|uniref:copper homeostasis membrane protein CopD n=1 Tax=Croceicoccus bisphenolivorans TaxID=1783232 RepID=UPI00082FEB65|nr:copper homeostasis membrane protein CopD [Croceicoccus bisphenolivorans]
MIDATVVFARFALFALTLGLAGVPLYLRINGVTRATGVQRLALGVCAVLVFCAAIWWAAAAIAAMAAMSLGDLDTATFRAVLDATPLGPVLKVRLAAALAMVLALALFPRNILLALLGTIVLAAGAWTGHAGATEGVTGTVHRVSDMLHLIGAAVWFGALAIFIASISGSSDRRDLSHRLERFARTGTIVVTVLALTGAANAWIIAAPGWSASSTWSLLLAAKVGLFFAMLALAGLNRWKLTPALKSGRPTAERNLRLSLSLEAGCAIAIVALVAILGLGNPAG